MHWKLKAATQNAIAMLPSTLSYALYYRLQRGFGGLRHYDPTRRLRAGYEIWDRLVRTGYNPNDKRFFEVGTGRSPVAPIAFWLMGARSTTTVDLNPYLQFELVNKTVRYLSENPAEVHQLLGDYLNVDRLEQLKTHWQSGTYTLESLLMLTGINYRAPADAAATGLPDGSFDFHVSYAVFEHIPPKVLANIIEEGARLLCPTGAQVHWVDYSDHFSHSDRRLSPINFLSYSDQQWSRYADNRYMYMNRLRHDDVRGLFLKAGREIRLEEAHEDQSSRVLVEKGEIAIDRRFREKEPKMLATLSSWFVA